MQYHHCLVYIFIRMANIRVFVLQFLHTQGPTREPSPPSPYPATDSNISLPTMLLPQNSWRMHGTACQLQLLKSQNCILLYIASYAVNCVYSSSVVFLWNSVPAHIINMKSVVPFRRALYCYFCTWFCFCNHVLFLLCIVFVAALCNCLLSCPCRCVVIFIFFLYLGKHPCTGLPFGATLSLFDESDK